MERSAGLNWRRLAWGPWLLLCLVTPVPAAMTLSLSVDRRRVPADGLSEVTVTAQVRRDGSLLSSGADVRFTCTQGVLGEYGGSSRSQIVDVPVRSGFAKCVLRATNFETSSVVTAYLLGDTSGATDRVEVIFGSEPNGPQTFDTLIRVKGDYIWYGPESSCQILDVIGHAGVTYQGVEIHANRIQIDLQDYLLLAKDLYQGVTIANGPPPYDAKAFKEARKPPYKGEALAMDLRSLTGSVYSSSLGETITFSGRNLARQPDRPPSQGMFDLFDLDGATIWIEAKGAAIYPSDKIRFDRAKFFVNGSKVLSLPYHFESLGRNGQLGPALSQVVNYSSRDGFIVDFPYYFDVGDRHTNEFRLTRGIRTGLFGRTTGFQLSYAHHAEMKAGRGQWDFVIDDMVGAFGVQYHRQERWDPYTFSTFSFAWPRHRNFYSNQTLYTPVGPGNVSMTMNADYLRGDPPYDRGFQFGNNVVWQSNPMRMTAVDSNFTMSMGLGYTHTLVGPDQFTQSVSLGVTKNPWTFGGGGSVQPFAGVRLQNAWDGSREVALTFNTAYRQPIGQTQSFSLGYTLDKAYNNRYRVPLRQLVTLNWQLYKEFQWTGYAYGTYNLNDRSLTASGMVEWYATRHWGFAGQTVYQTSPLGSFRESEVWVSRVIGTRELRLRYSLERARLSFELDNSF